jgi:hypothetical protein
VTTLYAIVAALVAFGALVWALVRSGASRAKADTERDALAEAGERSQASREAEADALESGRRRWL